MNKSTNNFGNSVLGQLISLTPNAIIDNAVKNHNSNKYIKRFTTLEHLVTMLFCIGSHCTSLREVCINLLGLEGKLKHIKLKQPPKKSTLADANKRRRQMYLNFLVLKKVYRLEIKPCYEFTVVF
ncbi:MAG TPA: DUF4372 domain-containing protein [Chitinophagaceae bacterium]|mgnify:CR=1 FL=1|nr:MAG: transposase IS4 family protein [Bacteroidetes bacterium OLB11]HMN31794.1 DUF4372 domain-containing protein [Chitinophagaceae bacterium]